MRRRIPDERTERIESVVRRALIVAALAAVGVGVVWFGIAKPQLVIDRLADRARPDRALPGPAVPPGPAGIEVALRDTYRSAPSNEDTTVTEADRLAVINRWTREIYPRFGAFMLACLLDPVTARTARALAGETPRETARNIRDWAAANLLHTQGREAFEGMPGNDPWGALNVFEPAYGKVLPSELIAKSVYTGKMTGKCCSLAAFIAGLFALNGAAPEDVVVFRLKSHVVGMVRFGGFTYLIDNQRVGAIEEDQKIRYWVEEMPFRGFFGYPFGIMKPLKVREDILSRPEGPLSYVASAAGASDLLPALAAFPAVALADRDALFSAVFGACDVPSLARVYALSRYAYQSLYVRDPSLYLKASLREPTVRELARRLKTAEQAIDWIRENVSTGPIFDDHAERIMTADQVIVYRKGTPKDQALLFAALRGRRGRDSTVLITRTAAYVRSAGRIYDARTWTAVEDIEGEVEVRITAK